MREIDITKQDIRCCDDFYIEDDGTVNILYELWFDANEYFGTNIIDENTWINFYTDYHKDGSITATYEVCTEYQTESFDWELTEVEQNFFRDMMDKYCEDTCDCTIKELVEDFKTVCGG